MTLQRLFSIALVPLVLAGCAEKTREPAATQKAGTGPPLVYATSYPLAYFAERIASPEIAVRFDVPGDIDPAYWKPTPDDVLAMQQADLILLNGASYESWLPTVSLPTSRLVVTTGGLEDRLLALEEETTHSHGPGGEHEHLGTAFTTWLDLSLAVEQARALTDALASRWPEHRDTFEGRFTALAEELQALDRELAAIVASDPRLPVIFSHPVYQYLEAHHGLNGRSLHWEPGEMPNAAMWLELATLVAESSARWMIWESEPLPQISQRLATLGVRTAVFMPCSNRPASGDFASVMQQNLQSLQVVFAADK